MYFVNSTRGMESLAFTELSCKFLKEVHSGDTLYPALEIINLPPKVTRVWSQPRKMCERGHAQRPPPQAASFMSVGRTSAGAVDAK